MPAESRYMTPARSRHIRRKTASPGATNVAIIGAGRGGTALMEIFANDPLVQIVGVAEVDPRAPGLSLAEQLGIPVTRDYRQLLDMERVDLIIDVSGSSEVWHALQDFHRMGVTVIGGASAKFMWELIEARIRATAEIEKTLTKYQSLYRLYVKESSAAVTEERTRIACEIHDGLVQSLAGVNFKLDLCQQLLRKNPKAGLATIKETKAQLKLAIQEARQVIFNLRPLHYDKMELIPALTNYFKSYETNTHIATHFTVTGDERTLFPRTKIFLFRIIQEALSNVEKHAKAKRVSIRLEIDVEMLRITIIDNGIGFDMEAVLRDPEKWDHFGIKGILERARLVGGEGRIESKKGHGTKVVVEVPLANRAKRKDGSHGEN
ncbi:putative Histidine kinase with N-terminal NAD-binding region [Candidatus Nitrospira inopinata]|uniref:Putative Histidine kinase with N-terminal NAD-binding region n=2 Tax=Candidatus Nitrospira inopinata TaxID=1715989 RepID=A0A0S4KU06_9BACT|nr:putative Histidine kinase with N-terminal NAD-binding region [Candidatus Nitrospira inopinata]